MAQQAGGSASTPAPDLTRQAAAWILAGLCLVALAARLYRLDSGFWIDEVYALRDSFRSPLGDVVTRYPGDNHHPLYAIFGRLMLVVFGESPWAVRLPAALAGVATIPVVYALARRVGGRVESLLAAAMLAVSYHHVWFSQNARGYTLMALLATVSTIALLRALEAPSASRSLQYALLAALGVYAHLTMVFVVFAHAAVAAIELWRPAAGRPRPDWKLLALAFVSAGLLTLALYAPLLDEVLAFFVNSSSDLEGTSTTGWALQEAIRVLLVGIGGPAALVGAVLLGAGGLIAVLGVLSIWRMDRNAALAFTLPAFAMLGGALLGRGTMYPRFFFFLAGIAVVIFARGVFSFADWLASRTVSPARARSFAVAVMLVVIAASAASLSFNFRYPKQDFVGAMEFVDASRDSSEAVGFAGVPGDPYRIVYGRPWPTVLTAADVTALRSGRRVWLIYTFPRYLELGAPEVAAIIARDCHDERVFPGTVGGGDIHVCVLESA